MDRIKTMLDQYRYQIIFGVTGALVLVLILLLLLLTGAVNKKPSTLNAAHSLNVNSSSQSVSGESTSEVANGPLFVDIKGAVNKPGMYQAKKDARVSDVINMAGGLKRNADIKTVNLAQKITDQQIIYIPQNGEQPAMEVNSSSTAGNAPSSNTSSNNKVNINIADAQQMQQVNGVGEKRAEQIIAYRNEHGQFKKIDDIKNVSGFGDKMFENMKESITV